MKHRLLVLVLAGAAGLALPGCETGEASVAPGAAADAPAALPVEVAWPATTELAAVLALSASATSGAEAVIPARVAGEVVEILVEEGARVRAGQPLARLDGERARLGMLKAGADLERAEREYRRVLSLRDRGLVSAAAFEAVAYERDALAATFELMRLAFQHTTIRATIDGVVAERHVKVGWRVEEGQPAFRIADVTRLIAELRVPQNELSRIRTGQPVAVTVDALPGARFAAAIDRVSPTVDPRDGSFRVTVYVDNRDGVLAPGMFGRFGIAYEVRRHALVVPSRALLREDNENVLYVVQDGAAKRRLVRVGIARPDVTEILDGLAAGEAVVVTGLGGLRDGSPVVARNAPHGDS
jgi:membrane fusion protein (multidrug efflux system)